MPKHTDPKVIKICGKMWHRYNTIFPSTPELRSTNNDTPLSDFEINVMSHAFEKNAAAADTSNLKKDTVEYKRALILKLSGNASLQIKEQLHTNLTQLENTLKRQKSLTPEELADITARYMKPLPSEEKSTHHIQISTQNWLVSLVSTDFLELIINEALEQKPDSSDPNGPT